MEKNTCTDQSNFDAATDKCNDLIRICHFLVYKDNGIMLQKPHWFSILTVIMEIFSYKTA